jgi:hypothetical protein
MFQALCRYIHVAITNQSLKVKVEIKILFPNLQKTSSKEGNFIAETPYSFHKLVDNNYTWHRGMLVPIITSPSVLIVLLTFNQTRIIYFSSEYVLIQFHLHRGFSNTSRFYLMLVLTCGILLKHTAIAT